MNQAATIAEFSDLSPAVQHFIARQQKLFIHGAWVDAVSGQTFDSIDPATEKLICKVAEAGPQSALRRLQAERHRQGTG
jgi:phenylacetaldehyde dehydrogenase